MKKSKGYAGGGKMKPKMSAKGMSKGGKLPMVEKDGKQVPFFAADGKGKMAGGGMVPKTKGYFKGGKIPDLREMAREGLGLPSMEEMKAEKAKQAKQKKQTREGLRKGIMAGAFSGGLGKAVKAVQKKSKGGVVRGSGAARPQMFRKDG
jgi:hypothetical protein